MIPPVVASESFGEDDPAAARDQLLRFFALAFAFTWGLQGPGVLAQEGILPGHVEAYLPMVALGVLGPMVAAWWVTRRTEGGEGVRALFAGLHPGRAHAAWWVAALVTPAALLTLGLAVHRLLGGQQPLTFPPEHAGRVVAGVIIAVGEEVGWRGFALPRLIRVFGPVRGTAVLGTAWTLWHIPMFLGVGVPMTLLPVMVVFFVAGSLVFTWFYARTGGSLLVAVALHLGAHLDNSHQPLPEDPTPLFVHTVAWTAAAALLLILDRTAWRRLAATRQTLSR